MTVDNLNTWFSRLLYVAAFLLLAVAVAERVVNLFGYTILGQSYAPGRLAEFSAIFLIFVVTLLLREIREELRKSAAGRKA